MKRNTFGIGLLVVGAVILGLTDCSPTRGSVTLEFETTSYGGYYSPANSGVVWVESEKGDFIRTLNVWAMPQRRHLIAWMQKSEGNDTDALTGASLLAHESHQVIWDCTDMKGKLVKDGTYHIKAEFTEDNSSMGGSPEGKVLTVALKKNKVDQIEGIEDSDFLKNIKLSYQAN